MRKTRIAAFFALFCLVLTAGHAFAADVTATAALDKTAIKAGESATINITVDVPPELHAQSNKPSSEDYIPFTVTMKPAAGIKFGEVVYPPGEDKTYELLGKLNVYTGRVVVKVPLTAEAGTTGPITISGFARYQACNDTACFPPKRLPIQVVLTVGDGPPATSQPTTKPTTAPAAAATPELPAEPPASNGLVLADNAYVSAFALAFFVGILFNAVPCVLPVVPLKIVGFYEAAQHNRRKCVMLGLAFSIGLVASFAVLAVLVVGLKTLTWGGLFQQTWFTITIVTVLLVMAISQFGIFTVNLPTAVYGFTPRHDTYVGNAMFGVLTAALSTPCTIGLFSAVLAWALKQTPTVGAASVVMVGCGMASPYLVLSAFPEVVRKFPRTGPVGEIIKQTLAFFVLATAFYFARPLLGSLISPPMFWWTLFAIVFAGMAFLAGKTIKAVGTPRAISIASGIAVVVTVGGLLGTLRLASVPYDWVPYSDEALRRPAGRASRCWSTLPPTGAATAITLKPSSSMTPPSSKRSATPAS
ncbi:MAG: protein-disulfide reductase DsbD family protein [Tepidisphaeraceae bacterium]